MIRYHLFLVLVSYKIQKCLLVKKNFARNYFVFKNEFQGHLPSYNAVTTPTAPGPVVGGFPMRGKDPGLPGTPGVPEPAPQYHVVTNTEENPYEMADENIVS